MNCGLTLIAQFILNISVKTIYNQVQININSPEALLSQIPPHIIIYPFFQCVKLFTIPYPY